MTVAAPGPALMIPNAIAVTGAAPLPGIGRLEHAESSKEVVA